MPTDVLDSPKDGVESELVTFYLLDIGELEYWTSWVKIFHQSQK